MRPDARAVHRRRLRLARLPEPADGHRRAGRQAAGPPVTLEATLAEGFTSATYRADTPHHVRLAADHDGRLQALTHQSWEFTSRPDDYKVAGADPSTRIYACHNIDSKVCIVHGDRDTPGFMRGRPSRRTSSRCRRRWTSCPTR